jgi:2-dehydro-3-deoxyphosphogluconate aldolase/(4S)-4-hydroxy-2-oxoglutarate aldolase
VAAPYTSLQFIPTGGINAANISKYIAYEKILACGGSWMVGSDLINAGNFEKITALCREAVLSMLDMGFVHIGINAQNEEEALKAAKFFEAFLGLGAKVGAASIFSSDRIEIMKNPGLGKNGHIGIGTTNVAKAAAYLSRLGAEFNADTARKDAKGDWTFVYFKEEIAGFAVHLVQRK